MTLNEWEAKYNIRHDEYSDGSPFFVLGSNHPGIEELKSLSDYHFSGQTSMAYSLRKLGE